MTKAMTPEQKATKAAEKKMKGMITFIEKMNAKNPGMFDWDGFVYAGTQAVDCTVKCVKHGEFTKKANALAKAKYPCDGCKKDALIENFIQKGRDMYGDQYDYSEVDGVDQDRVWITCTIHDERFEQIAKNHLIWIGCSYCSGKKRKEEPKGYRNRVNNREQRFREWKLKLEEKFPNTYDFSKVEYIDKKTPVTIICMIHDKEFSVTPDSVLPDRKARDRGDHSKRGQIFCCKIGHNEHMTTKRDDYINRAKVSHGSRYDYSLVPELVRMNSNISISCPDHGIFNQLAHIHLHNNNQLPSGCPLCVSSNGEKRISTYLKEIEEPFCHQVGFDDLIYISKLKYDFFIPRLNLYIEFDGEQHYKPVDYFGGEEGFRKCQIRDTIKTQYAKDNGLNLIRIRYDENLIQKLDEIFNP